MLLHSPAEWSCRAHESHGDGEGQMLADESGLEEKFWAKAVATAVYIINRISSSANDYNIPEEVWLGKASGYRHLRRFGCIVYVHIDQRKLKPRALKGVFVGYPTGVKGYRVWLLEDQKCVISRNAVFREDLVYKDIQKGKEEERQKEAT